MTVRDIIDTLTALANEEGVVGDVPINNVLAAAALALTINENLLYDTLSLCKSTLGYKYPYEDWPEQCDPLGSVIERLRLLHVELSNLERITRGLDALNSHKNPILYAALDSAQARLSEIPCPQED